MMKASGVKLPKSKSRWDDLVGPGKKISGLQEAVSLVKAKSKTYKSKAGVELKKAK